MGMIYHALRQFVDHANFQENDDVIIGFAIVFPKSNTQHTVEFAINTSLANEYYCSIFSHISNILFIVF